MQETFLDAYRSLRQLEEQRAFAAWLYQIARNNFRHAWRGQRGQALWSLDWLRARFGDRLPGSRQPDPANASAARDLIQQALDTLSPALREALLLHVLWGFTTSEISQLLHISPAAAGRRISRAQEQFRRSHAALERGHDGTLP